MFKTNEYFDGKVKSIAYETNEGPATVGVMKAGEYEFGTSSVEFMTVVSGAMKVLLPGESSFKNYIAGDTFVVEKNKKFTVQMDVDTAYLCLYR
ncbi:MAG: pyrimidine/purine nucleoside phosphorylase [Bacteroidetes bacterium]|jgi:uncharacterized protein YaiE (UPF0345 family)|nr:pyrimidine/purine nucleoside phosphorylase [Bacteroidota bacterium]